MGALHQNNTCYRRVGERWSHVCGHSSVLRAVRSATERCETDQIGHSPSPRRMGRTTQPGCTAYTSDDSIAGSRQALLRRTSRTT